MNKIQREYALAVARYQAADETVKEAEREYMAKQAIVNPQTGETVDCVCKIVWDDELFDRHNYGFEREYKPLHEEYTAAYNAREKAEESLIAFGLKLAPASIRDKLAEGVKHDYNIRKQFLDATFNLDTRTIPKGVRA